MRLRPVDQAAEQAKVHHVPQRSSAVLTLGRLQDHWLFLKPSVVHEQAERLFSHFASSNVLVTINTGAERSFAVVQVERLQPFRADLLVELPHRRPIVLRCSQGISGGEHVAGVETDSQAVRIFDAGEDFGEMLKPPPQVGSLPGRRFEEQLGFCPWDLAMDLVQATDNRACARLFTACRVRAWMHHESLQSQGIGSLQLDHHRVDRLLPERLVRAGEIDQIRIVPDRVPHSGTGKCRFECVDLFGRQLLRPPLIVVLGEDLQAFTGRLFASFDRLFKAAGNRHVGAEHVAESSGDQVGDRHGSPLLCLVRPRGGEYVCCEEDPPSRIALQSHMRSLGVTTGRQILLAVAGIAACSVALAEGPDLGERPESADGLPQATVADVEPPEAAGDVELAADVEPAVDAEEVSRLIDNLAAKDFRLREAASRELVRLGIAAMPWLERAARDPDLEIRRRAERIIAVVTEAAYDASIAAFEADFDGRKKTTLPGFQSAETRLGNEVGDRQLFVRLYRAEPQIFSTYDADPQATSTLFIERVRVHSEAFRGRRNWQRIRAGRVNRVENAMALLFVGSDDRLDLTEEAISSFNSLLQQMLPAKQLASLREQDRVREWLGGWIVLRSVRPGLEFTHMHLGLKYEVPEAVSIAKRVLKRRQREMTVYPFAMMCIGYLGTEADAPALERLLDDKSNIFSTRGTFAGRNRRNGYSIQVRDFALAMLVELTAQDLNAYGFENVDRGAMRNQFYQQNSFYFSDEEARAAAFKKWYAYKKAQQASDGDEGDASDAADDGDAESKERDAETGGASEATPDSF